MAAAETVDGAGVAHASVGRGVEPGDVGDHRLRGFFALQELGRLFLGGAADLADKDDSFGGVVGEKQLQAVDKIHAVDGIAADADRGRLPQMHVSGLVHGFVVEQR